MCQPLRKEMRYRSICLTETTWYGGRMGALSATLDKKLTTHIYIYWQFIFLNLSLKWIKRVSQSPCKLIYGKSSECIINVICYHYYNQCMVVYNQVGRIRKTQKPVSIHVWVYGKGKQWFQFTGSAFLKKHFGWKGEVPDFDLWCRYVLLVARRQTTGTWEEVRGMTSVKYCS